MEEIKQKVEDLELALNYVCYDADLIPKLQTVWQKLELLQEVVNKKCNIPHVSISLPSDEEIREPIQNAIYATGSYTTDQCTEFADGILTYLNEAGFKVVRQ